MFLGRSIHYSLQSHFNGRDVEGEQLAGLTRSSHRRLQAVLTTRCKSIGKFGDGIPLACLTKERPRSVSAPWALLLMDDYIYNTLYVRML